MNEVWQSQEPQGFASQLHPLLLEGYIAWGQPLFGSLIADGGSSLLIRKGLMSCYLKQHLVMEL